MTARDWTPQQQAFFDDVQRGDGNTVLLARAGTGKTTTLVEALMRVPRDVCCLMLAFNRSIADELKRRVQAPNVEIATCHSFGLRCVTRGLGRLKIDGGRAYGLARSIVEGRYSRAEAFDAKRAICKVASLAKGTLLNGDPDTAPAGLLRLADDFGVDIPGCRTKFAACVLELLQRCVDVSDGALDFDDMIWLPAVKGLTVPKFARVFVDETQDLNHAQLSLAMRALAPTGRFFAVGDDRQAIYGFRGADSNAVGRVVSALDAKTLPLSVTFRCPRAVVELAREEVPDFESHPTSPAGIVRQAPVSQLAPSAGDVVLSRVNAPLVSLCLRWLAEGIRCHIAGRDIGEALMSLIGKLGAETVNELREYVTAWAANEIARLQRLDPPAEAAADAVADKRDCLLAISDGARTIDDVEARLEELFADDGHPGVTLSSTHKAKGLEWDRVWVLADTYRRSSLEERNLWYVAITRTRQELVLVHKET